MAEIIPTYEELLRTGIHFFYDKYNKNLPTAVGCAPGRVNLIGGHTDYNNGFVFPMGLPMVTMMIGAENNLSKINIITDANFDVYSATFKTPDEVDLVRGEPEWANYVKGIIKYFKGGNIPGFNAVIVSSIPLDAGLAGSAALEVATYNFLEKLTGRKTDDMIKKALFCQTVEHDFAHHPCGIMDQFNSVFARKGYAILLDCSNLNFNHVPFEDPNVVILLINSHAPRKQAASQYALRRSQCDIATKVMNLKSLRDGGTKDLQKYRTKLEDDVFHRARHVITENERTISAAQALRLKDFTSFGLLMLQSHNSIRDDFGISCYEVDQLIELTMNAKGVFGSRMTGGGFGGCTVSLVKSEHVDSVIQHIRNNYTGKATFYIVTACGANLDLNPLLNEINAEIVGP